MGMMRRQPRGLVRLNMTNPLAQAIEFVLQPGTRMGSPFVLPTTGYTTPVITPGGIAHSVQTPTDVQAYPTGAIGNLENTDFTLAVIVNQTGNSASAWRGMFGKRNATSDTGHWSLGITTGGRLQFAAVGITREMGNLNLSDRENAMYGVTYSRTRSVMTGFQDGVSLGTATGFAAIPAGNVAPIRIGAFRGDNLNESFKGTYLLVVVWKRELTVQEMADFYANPWQIFEDPFDDEEDFLAMLQSLVSANLNASYSVRAAVAKELAPNYAVRSAIATNLPAAYSVFQSASANISGDYRVLSSVTRSLVADYIVRAAIATDLSTDYRVLAAVANEVTGSYAIYTGVSNDLFADYQVLSSVSVTTSLNASYRVLGAVNRDLSPSYAVRSVVSNNLAPAYAVLQAVAREFSAVYKVVAAVRSDLLGVYAVLAAIMPGMVAPPRRTVTFTGMQHQREVKFVAHGRTVNFVAHGRTVEFEAVNRTVEFKND